MDPCQISGACTIVKFDIEICALAVVCDAQRLVERTVVYGKRVPIQRATLLVTARKLAATSRNSCMTPSHADSFKRRWRVSAKEQFVTYAARSA